MNYEEMSDLEVNQAVTGLMFDCAEWPLTQCGKYFYHCGIDGSAYFDREVIDYCNNPSDAWPIISVMIDNGCVVQMLQAGVIVTMQGGGRIQFMDKNPLRAAMIVFLMMQEQDK